MILLTAKEDKLIIIIIHTHFVKCNVVQVCVANNFPSINTIQYNTIQCFLF